MMGTNNPAFPSDPAGARFVAGGKKLVGDFHDQFVSMICKAQSKVPPPVARSGSAASRREPSLDTSTFTVCLRARPLLGDELTARGESFNCVIPGAVNVDGSDRTEQAILFTPKVGITGRPSLTDATFAFDHVFGPARDGEDVYAAVGEGLVRRALAGQTGVVFAFGQTGSGKTHTMNGLMDRLVTELFADSSSTRRITFSYMEILGSNIKDCLATESDVNGPTSKVQIGELLDGRAVVKNLSEHLTSCSGDLSALIDVAKSRRTTKATEKNDTSSRSHGVGIVRVGHVGFEAGTGPAEGLLYIIDLAGSERSDDSKGHSKSLMDETKEINLSLMTLKECIRARTLASGPGGASIHVPYRRSKLTLLMKDVFDVGCARMCSTVVLAHVSPLAGDVRHTTNTMNYSAPLRVAVNDTKKMERDERDPANWDSDRIRDWCETTAGLDAAEVYMLLPRGTTGIELCQTSEVEIYRRLAGKHDKAKCVYQGLWTLICDAKTRKRRSDGSIVTPEQEAAEIDEARRLQEEKIKLWAEREKSMRSEF